MPPSATGETPKSNNIKRLPLTVGALLVIGALITGAITTAFSVAWSLKSTAKAEVKSHEIKDLEEAHKTLPRDYVRKGELKDQMHHVQRKLDKLDDRQKRNTEVLERILVKVERRRRRTP